MWQNGYTKNAQSGWHIHDIFQKQNPVTSVSTAPAAQLINDIDTGISQLAAQCGEMNQIMSQARSTNIESQATIALQKNIEALRQKLLSLTEDIAMIREAHASVAQMQPLAPVQPNDPMAASMEQQPPMNPMGGGMPQGGM